MRSDLKSLLAILLAIGGMFVVLAFAIKNPGNLASDAPRRTAQSLADVLRGKLAPISGTAAPDAETRAQRTAKGVAAWLETHLHVGVRPKTAVDMVEAPNRWQVAAARFAAHLNAIGVTTSAAESVSDFDIKSTRAQLAAASLANWLNGLTGPHFPAELKVVTTAETTAPGSNITVGAPPSVAVAKIASPAHESTSVTPMAKTESKPVIAVAVDPAGRAPDIVAPASKPSVASAISEATGPKIEAASPQVSVGILAAAAPVSQTPGSVTAEPTSPKAPNIAASASADVAKAAIDTAPADGSAAGALSGPKTIVAGASVAPPTLAVPETGSADQTVAANSTSRAPSIDAKVSKQPTGGVAAAPTQADPKLPPKPDSAPAVIASNLQDRAGTLADEASKDFGTILSKMPSDEAAKAKNTPSDTSQGATQVAPDRSEGGASETPATLAFSSLRYDANVESSPQVTIAGRGNPGKPLVVYLDGTKIATTVPASNGHWLVTAKQALSLGQHMARVDQPGDGGKSAETTVYPFAREAAQAEGKESVIVPLTMTMLAQSGGGIAAPDAAPIAAVDVPNATTNSAIVAPPASATPAVKVPPAVVPAPIPADVAAPSVRAKVKQALAGPSPAAHKVLTARHPWLAVHARPLIGRPGLHRQKQNGLVVVSVYYGNHKIVVRVPEAILQAYGTRDAQPQ